MPGTTPIYGLRYAIGSDPPSIPVHTNNIATDVEAQLAKMFTACTSLTRPASPGVGSRIYETDTGLQYTWNGAKWMRDATWLYKTAAQATPASSTVFQTVANFGFPGEANCKYIFDSWVSYTATTAGDLKLQWLLPASATMKWSTYGPPSTSTTFGDIYQGIASTAGPLVLGGQSGVPMVARLAGMITILGTPGTISLQFGQNAADPAPAVIDADSWLTYKQVA